MCSVGMGVLVCAVWVWVCLHVHVYTSLYVCIHTCMHDPTEHTVIPVKSLFSKHEKILLNTPELLYVKCCRPNSPPGIPALYCVNSLCIVELLRTSVYSY